MLGWLVHLCHFLFHLACLLSVTSNRWGKEERQYQIGKSKQYTEIVSTRKPAQRSLCAVLVLSPPIFLHTSSIPLFPLKFSSCNTDRLSTVPSSLPLRSALFSHLTGMNLCGQTLLVRRHKQSSRNSWCYIKHIGRF